MEYLLDYDDENLLNSLISELYDSILESDDRTKDVLVAGTASGIGWAVGSEIFSELKNKNIIPSNASAKKYIPYAIAGSALFAGLGALAMLLKKKKNIKYLLSNEKDPVKRENLKKELNSLSRREIIELKKYKEAEEKAKLQAKIRLSKEDKNKLALDIKNGVIQKEKLDILKKDISDNK